MWNSRRHRWRRYMIANELDSSDDESIHQAMHTASSTNEGNIITFDDKEPVMHEDNDLAPPAPEPEILLVASSIASDDEPDVPNPVEEAHLQQIVVTVHGLKGYHPYVGERIYALSSQVREFSFLVDSIIQKESPRLGMQEAAEKLLKECMELMDEDSNTSLIFLGYDIGGTIVKQVRTTKIGSYSAFLLISLTFFAILGTSESFEVKRICEDFGADHFIGASPSNM
ncbi:hypothetical protein ACMFMF_011689 [Clarireedia jacksonii]